MPQLPESIRLIRVFGYSPGDVTAELKALDEVIANVNDVIGRAKELTAGSLEVGRQRDSPDRHVTTGRGGHPNP